MYNRPQASKLRRRIVRLAARRSAIERQLLGPRRMMAASLIERHLGTRREKRASSAFYLSYVEGGRTRLIYVAKPKMDRVRAQVDAWKAYRAAVRRWRQLTEMMMELIGELGEAQARRPGGGKS